MSDEACKECEQLNIKATKLEEQLKRFQTEAQKWFDKVQRMMSEAVR